MRRFGFASFVSVAALAIALVAPAPALADWGLMRVYCWNPGVTVLQATNVDTGEVFEALGAGGAFIFWQVTRGAYKIEVSPHYPGFEGVAYANLRLTGYDYATLVAHNVDLKGYVYGKDVEGPVEGADIALYRWDQDDGWTEFDYLTTDEDGYWRGLDLPDGRYKVGVQAEGYEDLYAGPTTAFEWAKELRVPEDSATPITLELSAAAGEIQGRVSEAVSDVSLSGVEMSLFVLDESAQEYVLEDVRPSATDGTYDLHSWDIVPGDTVRVGAWLPTLFEYEETEDLEFTGFGQIVDVSLSHDATPPSIEVESEQWGNEAEVRLQASDTGTGVARITYRVDQGAPVTVGEDTATFVLGVGDHEIEVVSADFFGNVSEPETFTLSIGAWSAAIPVQVGGANRYDVAARLAYVHRPDLIGYTDVIVACGEDRAMADPLGASALAGEWAAPILLTPSARLNPTTEATIKAIRNANGGKVNIHVIGGTTSIPATVYARLAALRGSGSIERINGSDRYILASNMAARLISEMQKRGAQPTAIAVVDVSDPRAWGDILAASPVLASARIPLAPMRRSYVPPTTLGMLARPELKEVPLLAINTYWTTAYRMQELGCSDVMATSPNRATASVEIAQWAIKNGLADIGEVAVVNKMTDALTGGAFIGQRDGVLLYVDRRSVPTSVASFVSPLRYGVDRAWVLGGPASVDGAALNQFKSVLNRP